MKTNSQKKVDLEQNSDFNMYNIVFADLIEASVLPNAVYSLTLESIRLLPQTSAHHNDVWFKCFKLVTCFNLNQITFYGLQEALNIHQELH